MRICGFPAAKHHIFLACHPSENCNDFAIKYGAAAQQF
jgi:hypothetical protein